MKKYSIYAFLAALLFLQGCGAAENDSNSAEEVSGQASQEQRDTNKDLSEDKVKNTEEQRDQKEKQEQTDPIAGKDENNVKAEKTYQINENTWTVDPITDADSKVALLTIDDAPDENTLKIAQTLKSLDVSAIFFVNGHLINTLEKEKTIKKIYDLGFAVGNHTYSHSNLKDLSEAEQKEEIIQVNNMVERITGEKPRFFRAPFGSNTDFSKKLAAEENMTVMNWTYGYDWEKDYQTKETLADIMVNTPYLSDGANLLMHDRPWTMEAMEDIVKGLKTKGYTIVNPDNIN